MVSDRDFLFIIGSPRSGTTWLQLMIGAHSQVSTAAELRIFNAYLHRWIRAWEEESNNIQKGTIFQGLPMLISAEELYDFLKSFLEFIYGRVLATNPEATHILDKHPGYTLHTEMINKFFPQARFIHIIRDGRDVAVSMVEAHNKMGFGTGTIYESSIEWKRHIQMGRRARKYGSRYLELRYEDLLMDCVSTLETVFRFCGLPYNKSVISEIVSDHEFERIKQERKTAVPNVNAPRGFYRKGKAGSWREEFSPMQRYIFNRLAGDLLTDLGYAETGWWADHLLQKYWIAMRFRLTRLIPTEFRSSLHLMWI